MNVLVLTFADGLPCLKVDLAVTHRHDQPAVGVADLSLVGLLHGDHPVVGRPSNGSRTKTRTTVIPLAIPQSLPGPPTAGETRGVRPPPFRWLTARRSVDLRSGDVPSNVTHSTFTGGSGTRRRRHYMYVDDGVRRLPHLRAPRAPGRPASGAAGELPGRGQGAGRTRRRQSLGRRARHAPRPAARIRGHRRAPPHGCRSRDRGRQGHRQGSTSARITILPRG